MKTNEHKPLILIAFQLGKSPKYNKHAPYCGVKISS